MSDTKSQESINWGKKGNFGYVIWFFTSQSESFLGGRRDPKSTFFKRVVLLMSYVIPKPRLFTMALSSSQKHWYHFLPIVYGQRLKIIIIKKRTKKKHKDVGLFTPIVDFVRHAS